MAAALLTLLFPVRLFSQAAVVFGFHGAGHVNVLFAPEGCLVVELTFWADEDATKVWRTNRDGIIKDVPSVRWITHALVPGAANITGLAEAADKDHFLKGQTLFDVPVADLHNLALAIDGLVVG